VNRRSLFVPATALSAAILFAACGSSGTTAPSVAGAAPTSAAATTAVSTPAAPAATQGSVNTSVPSFATDSGLAAKFPATVDGQPVTNVQTALFADVMRQSPGTTDAEFQALSQKLSAIGIDFATMSFGSGQATVDGKQVAITGLRTPNSDANKIIQNYGAIVDAFGSPPETLPTMSQSTAGGKTVTLSVDSNGTTTTLYVSGDTLFILRDLTDSQKGKIVAALP
jgi:hypothetical protein